MVTAFSSMYPWKLLVPQCLNGACTDKCNCSLVSTIVWHFIWDCNQYWCGPIFRPDSSLRSCCKYCVVYKELPISTIFRQLSSSTIVWQFLWDWNQYWCGPIFRPDSSLRSCCKYCVVYKELPISTIFRQLSSSTIVWQFLWDWNQYWCGPIFRPDSSF